MTCGRRDSQNTQRSGVGFIKCRASTCISVSFAGCLVVRGAQCVHAAAWLIMAWSRDRVSDAQKVERRARSSGCGGYGCPCDNNRNAPSTQLLKITFAASFCSLPNSWWTPMRSTVTVELVAVDTSAVLFFCQRLSRWRFSSMYLPNVRLQMCCSTSLFSHSLLLHIVSNGTVLGRD